MVAATELVEARGGLELVVLGDLRTLGADAVATSRAGGVSVAPYDTLNLGDHVGDDAAAVAENRRRLASALGVAPDALVIARQVHGRDVAVVTSGDAPGDVDALVTRDGRVAICVLVADCVPVVVLDPDARVLAVVHAGWRGVVAGVVGAALTAMAREGADPARCHAAIGPCVSARAYQVGDDVATALRCVGLHDHVRPDGTGRHLADLAGSVVAQLVAAGLREADVTAPTSFTDGGARFFSDRAIRPCGRGALAARLVDPGS